MSKDLRKVLFVGLDNGGKTSILLLLNKKFSLMSNIKPTFKANITSQSISLLGMEVSNWDLGGPKSYRETYLQNKEKYFSELQTIFYVIDIQAPERNEQVLNYLRNIVDVILEKDQQDVRIMVLFHKCDPDIEEDPAIQENIHTLKDRIQDITDKLHFFFYETTIYDEATLIKPFSDGVIAVSHKAKLIQSLLKEYMKRSFNSATLLLDKHGFILASRATKDSYIDICTFIAPRFTYAIEKLEDWDILPKDIVTNIEFPHAEDDGQREGLIFLRKLELENERLYLISLCLNKRVKQRSYEYLPLLAKNLKNLLEKYE